MSNQCAREKTWNNYKLRQITGFLFHHYIWSHHGVNDVPWSYISLRWALKVSGSVGHFTSLHQLRTNRVGQIHELLEAGQLFFPLFKGICWAVPHGFHCQGFNRQGQARTEGMFYCHVCRRLWGYDRPLRCQHFPMILRQNHFLFHDNSNSTLLSPMVDARDPQGAREMPFRRFTGGWG